MYTIQCHTITHLYNDVRYGSYVLHSRFSREANLVVIMLKRIDDAVYQQVCVPIPLSENQTFAFISFSIDIITNIYMYYFIFIYLTPNIAWKIE